MRELRVQHAAMATALLLQLVLVAFGIVRTDTVVNVNNFFPFADKLWHCIYYGVLALLLWHATGRRALASSMLLVCFALVDEAIQAMTPGRSASVIDLAFDVAAGLAVIATARLRPTRVNALAVRGSLKSRHGSSPSEEPMAEGISREMRQNHGKP